tara:strand:- start:121 stop:321 length:201 start_codon:yes stop_codon:yes gene_type:complete
MMPELVALGCWLLVGALIYLRASRGAGVLFCPPIQVRIGERFTTQDLSPSLGEGVKMSPSVRPEKL